MPLTGAWHSRHYDTSVRFITGNVQDFFANEEAESIINNAFMKVLHRTEEIAEWQDVVGLNDRQVEFVQRAQTGSAGHSEALVESNGRWYPLQVFATEAEDAVIDYDPGDSVLVDG